MEPVFGSEGFGGGVAGMGLVLGGVVGVCSGLGDMRRLVGKGS